jgi:hypothetical protein
MREQRAAARGLEAQGRAKLCGVDPDQQEIVTSGEMPRRRLGELLRRREMDEAVTRIDGRAAIDAFLFRHLPFLATADLEDELHLSSRLLHFLASSMLNLALERLAIEPWRRATYHDRAKCESRQRRQEFGQVEPLCDCERDVISRAAISARSPMPGRRDVNVSLTFVDAP